MEYLNQALELLKSAEGASVAIALVLEFVLRLIKSEKPLGILRMIAAAGHLLAKVIEAAADLLDKVLPQKLAEPAKVEPPK